MSEPIIDSSQFNGEQVFVRQTRWVPEGQVYTIRPNQKEWILLSRVALTDEQILSAISSHISKASAPITEEKPIPTAASLSDPRD